MREVKSCISLRENSSPQTETKFVQLQNKNGKSLICGAPQAKKSYKDFNFEARKIFVPSQI